MKVNTKIGKDTAMAKSFTQTEKSTRVISMKAREKELQPTLTEMETYMKVSSITIS